MDSKKKSWLAQLWKVRNPRTSAEGQEDNVDTGEAFQPKTQVNWVSAKTYLFSIICFLYSKSNWHVFIKKTVDSK